MTYEELKNLLKKFADHGDRPDHEPLLDTLLDGIKQSAEAVRDAKGEDNLLKEFLASYVGLVRQNISCYVEEKRGQEEHGIEPSHMFPVEDALKVVDALIEAGAPVVTSDEYRPTIIHYLLSSYCSMGQHVIAEVTTHILEKHFQNEEKKTHLQEGRLHLGNYALQAYENFDKFREGIAFGLINERCLINERYFNNQDIDPDQSWGKLFIQLDKLGIRPEVKRGALTGAIITATTVGVCMAAFFLGAPVGAVIIAGAIISLLLCSHYDKLAEVADNVGPYIGMPSQCQKLMQQAKAAESRGV